MSFLRGNQYVKLKLKIPTKLTPKQAELIAEFDKAAAFSYTDKTEKECKQTFNIQQAWKRLKDFLGTSDDKDKSSPAEPKVDKAT